MRIYCKKTDTTYKATLKRWSNSQWSPNFLSDMWETLPYDGDQEAYVSDDFLSDANWWESECEDFNNGAFSEILGEREPDSEDEIHFDYEAI